MKFVQCVGGGWVNLDHVQSISGPRHNEKKTDTIHRLYNVAGDQIGEVMGGYFEIDKWSQEVVPAQKDWFIVEVCEAPDGPVPVCTPIVAWRVDGHTASPVCLTDFDETDPVVLAPTGGVSSCFNTWDSLDEYIKSYTKK